MSRSGKRTRPSPADAASRPPQGEGALRGRRRSIGGALVILGLVIVAYIPAMQGGYIWDDDDYVTNNENLLSPAGLYDIWFKDNATPQYYPLVFTTFWIEYRLWGLDPLGYHIVNMLLHACGAILLWRVLRRLAVPGAWLAAAVFAVHPVCVESVAWITERKNVLSGALYFASLLMYIRFSQLDKADAEAKRRWPFYMLAFGLFACALFSKTVTCTLPAAVGLLIWWKRGRIRLRDVWPLIPMLLLGLYMGWQTAHLEKVQVGAGMGEWALSWPEKILVAGRAIWFYLGKILWPWQLTFIYPRWSIDATLWWQWLFPISAVAVVVVLFLLRHRWGRSPVVAALFFGGTLFPALSFVDVYPMRFSFVADHFQYLAMVGPITLAIGVASHALSRIRPGGTRGKDARKNRDIRPQTPGYVQVGAGALLLVILGALTWRQGLIYKNKENLWRDTIAKNPTAWIAYNNLGVVLNDRKDFKEAAGILQTALELRPDYPEALNNLCVALTQLGRYDEAVHYGEQSILARQGWAKGHDDLAVALMQVGRLGEAWNHAQRALALDPDSAKNHNDLALILAKLRRYAEAMEEYQIALSIDPDNAPAHTNLGDLLVQLGRIDEAIEHHRAAVALDPESPAVHNNLGNALAMKRQLPEAIEQWKTALRLKPGLAETHNNLANGLAMMGRMEEAIEHWREALRLNPDLPEARHNLNQAQQMTNPGG